MAITGSRIQLFPGLTSTGSPTIGAVVISPEGSILGTGVTSRGTTVGPYETERLITGDFVSHCQSILDRVLPIRITASSSGCKIDEQILQLYRGLGDLRRTVTAAVSQAVWSTIATRAGCDMSVLIRDSMYPGTRISRRQSPSLLANMIGGGQHEGSSNTIVETMALIRNDMAEASSIAITLFEEVGRQARQRNILCNGVGREGTYRLTGLSDTDGESLDLLSSSITSLGFEDSVGMAVDVAGNLETSERASMLVSNWRQRFDRLQMIEDPVSPLSDSEWSDFVGRFPELAVAADDLTSSRAERAGVAADVGASHVVAKIDQAGSITELLEFVSAARAKGLCVIASHRSQTAGDTNIVDVAFGIGADILKIGSPSRERVACYNRAMALSH